MTKKLIPTALAAAMLLAGCSLIPTYERPAAPVPTTYPGDPAQPGGQASAALPWQDFFADPRLAGLIQTALANNRDLRVSVLNIEQARAQFQIERSSLFPALGLTGSGSRSSPNSLQGVEGMGSVASQYSVNFGFTAWELDFFGRIRALKDQALSQYLATEETRKAVQISLIASVANGWLTLLADDELLELTRQTMVTRDESVRLTKMRFDNGVSSELDFQAANSLAETARAAYAQQQRARMQDENALALLLGAPVPAEATAGGANGLEGIKPMPDVPAGLPSDLLAERPDIRAAEQQLIAANANIGAARANFFPRVSLTSGIGTASTEFSGLFDRGSKAWSFAPTVTLPIFDAGRNFATLNSAKAGREIAVAQYEKSVQTAFREVADALAGRATLGEEVRAQRAQATAEGVRFKLSDLRYRNGIASALDLLDAQRSLFTAQQLAINARLLQLQNQVTLYKTLGGGWATRDKG
ncbi:efflux transporter outer membrane subunit [Variovorax sp. PAMC26660]|uniref:efflux transporter outer membrane subunit n=1 Tax=Variovorax sp. PAMC26660 TaxID=2762322 RepID=UPI00164DCC34|nr:efflux transporter outer membrane subunit [Variovorax sp. PAMC26660]QNK69776.1 efflux transporter outer membrane subunit [Variovorax sp. PAMC26660]